MMSEDTRIVGTLLPNLRVELVHRDDREGGTEHLFLHLAATPNLDSALRQPLLAPWLEMSQAMMAPWLGLAAANPWTRPWLALMSPPSTRDEK